MAQRGWILALGLAVTMAWGGGAAAAEAKRAPLGPEDRADIARAETYLNGVLTLKARFLQVSANGASAEGDAYLSRPGKLRLQYDPPSPLLVVADGSFLIVHDRELGAPSYVPLGSTPAGILVRAGVKLDGGDLSVTKVARPPGLLRITVTQTEDNAAGDLTLVFSERPFELRQWEVRDAQHQVTTVSLFEARSGVKLDPKLFEFVNPEFARPKLNQ